MIDLAEAIRDAHGVADIAALDRARGQLADLLLCLETRRCGPGAVKVCPICRASLNGAATCRRCRADPAMLQAVERRGRTLAGAAMLALVPGGWRRRRVLAGSRAAGPCHTGGTRVGKLAEAAACWAGQAAEQERSPGSRTIWGIPHKQHQPRLLMPCHRHHPTLTETSRQAQETTRIGCHKQMSFVPAPQRPVGRQHRIMPQMFGQTTLHTTVPPFRHSP